jgi:hypothetical protein
MRLRSSAVDSFSPSASARHETATTNADADVRALFATQQKLLEQNIATWHHKEQQAVGSLDRIAKRFEETANQCAGQLQTACGEFQSATKEHHTAARQAQQWVARVSLENRFWPCLGSVACGALLALLVAHFLRA